MGKTEIEKKEEKREKTGRGKEAQGGSEKSLNRLKN